MVNAILDGRKTQTRRVVQSPAKNMQAAGAEVIKHRDPGDKWYGDHVWSMRGKTGVWGDYTQERFLSMCPYGMPGDRLWVRETWGAHFIWESIAPRDIQIDNLSCIFYQADNSVSGNCESNQRGKWRPSIHMPRKASRILLEITDVRVKRLQDISEEDAKAEGVWKYGVEDCWKIYTKTTSFGTSSARRSFESLWQSINGADSWDANPWVWVVEFKQVENQS